MRQSSFINTFSHVFLFVVSIYSHLKVLATGTKELSQYKEKVTINLQDARSFRSFHIRNLRETLQLATSIGSSDDYCHDKSSFLGVGNTLCLRENISTAVFLLSIIIAVSMIFEKLIHKIRHAIKCPQLRNIVNRVFEELMIMGFISMVIFTLNTSGLLKHLNFNFDGLSPSEQLHFYEFFHYIVFMTMIYFILIILLLLFIGTVAPKLIWKTKKENQKKQEEDIREEIEDFYDRNVDRSDDNIEGSGLEDEEEKGRFSGEEEEERYFKEIEHDVEIGRSRSSQTSSRRGRNGRQRNTLRQRRQQRNTQVSRYSGMDLVLGTRAYSLLQQRYQREGWCFRFNLKKQWHLWKSFELLAYSICQNRSGYIYKNPEEMERIFGVGKDKNGRQMTYERYHELCMRNLLYTITHVHFSAFFVLLVICILPSLFPRYDHWIFIGVGIVLLLVSITIFFKVLHILRGIIHDRLKVITMREIRQVQETARENSTIIGRQSSLGGASGGDGEGTDLDKHLLLPEASRLSDTHYEEPSDVLHSESHRPSLKVVALAVRSIIRMQMSALCHRQLHYHDDRFWFNSPKFLLRLFQFATIGQAFYLVWLSLVEIEAIIDDPKAIYLLPIMLLLPIVSLFIVTPMTMPSLVLVMSLTGIFFELNGEESIDGLTESNTPKNQKNKERIRVMRRSFLRSHYTDADEPISPTSDSTTSPGRATFLRMYDSPRDSTSQSGGSRRPSFDYEESPHLRMSRKQFRGESGDFSIVTRHHGNCSDATIATTTNVPLSVIETVASPPTDDLSIVSPKTTDFKSYCSKYGGYPEL